LHTTEGNSVIKYEGFSTYPRKLNKRPLP